MIFIGRFNEVHRNEYDRTYAIVRNMKNPSDWIEQLQVLSPSKELFFRYLDLKKAGKWNADAFKNIYVPQFIAEMKSLAAREALKKLCEDDKAGKNVALVCFCPDETLCHRSIIAGMLQGVGADVRLASNMDYSHYYAMYKN